MHGVPVSSQADPDTGVDAANDHTLIAVCHVGGLDILGPFPRAVGGYRHLYATIDKFTKWPKATPVVKINKQSIVKFIKSLVCRFGVPNRIIIDNGPQFTSRVFQDYCEDLDIQICYASVAHPESNGQVERANAKILRGLKTRTYDFLKMYGAKSIDELSCMLWANRTSSNRATWEMPFLLVYGAVGSRIPTRGG
jgi:transposase InsO family protein